MVVRHAQVLQVAAVMVCWPVEGLEAGRAEEDQRLEVALAVGVAVHKASVMLTEARMVRAAGRRTGVAQPVSREACLLALVMLGSPQLARNDLTAQPLMLMEAADMGMSLEEREALQALAVSSYLLTAMAESACMRLTTDAALVAALSAVK